MMRFFAHEQTVDIRPLFPPPTWPGYEASSQQELNPGHLWLESLELPVLMHSVQHIEDYEDW